MTGNYSISPRSVEEHRRAPNWRQLHVIGAAQPTATGQRVCALCASNASGVRYIVHLGTTHPTRDALSRARLAVDDLRRLPRNWNGQASEAPNRKALAWAEDALATLADLDLIPPSRIVASAQGGVTLYFLGAGKYGTLEFFNTGDVIIAKVPNNAPPDIREVPAGSDTVAEALAELSEFAG